jgi:hypothetical protein
LKVTYNVFHSGQFSDAKYALVSFKETGTPEYKEIQVDP